MNTRQGLARLIEVLAPGGRLVRLTRLRGGLGARTHRLRLEDASGVRRNLVLRRYVKGGPDTSVEGAVYEFAVLGLLQAAGVPAPRPLWLDSEGGFFDGPAMVLSYLPGRSWFVPRDPLAFAAGLAQAALAVHAVTPQRYDLSGLRVKGRDELSTSLAKLRETRAQSFAARPLLRDAYEVVVGAIEVVPLPPPCLVHYDYFPGNTVWYRGRLAGVIDWGTAALSDSRLDIAQCRLDLVLSHDAGVADAFLEAYGRGSPGGRPQMWFFDLYVGLWALVYYQSWLRGYHDAGLTHLKAEDVIERLEAFVRRALEEARAV